MGITLNLEMVFGSNDILTILILIIHEHGIKILKSVILRAGKDNKNSHMQVVGMKMGSTTWKTTGNFPTTQ